MNEQPKNETPQSTEAQAATGFSGPRWAKDLGEETWDKINTLLHDGWDTPDIIRELELPTSKLRSLQIYAAKFGPRRRLILFNKFKECCLSGAVEFGPQFMQAMGLVAQKAVSTKVKDSTQQKACALMTLFMSVLAKSMKPDVDAEIKETAVEKEIGSDAPRDAKTMLADLLALYGDPTGAGGGNGQ